MHLCLYRKLIKRDPSGQSHIPKAKKPLIRLLRLQKLENTTDHGINTIRPRVR